MLWCAAYGDVRALVLGRREAKIDAEIARLRQQLLVIEEEIKATDTKLDEVTCLRMSVAAKPLCHVLRYFAQPLDDRTYNRWNDKLASLREEKKAINAQLVKLEGQKEALFNAGMRLLLLSQDW